MEVLKVYSIVVIWLDRTILMMKIEPDNETLLGGMDPFLKSNQYLRLKIYITINAICTFLISFWAMRKMIISFRVRISTHRDLLQAKDEEMVYNTSVNAQNDLNLGGNNLKERILKMIE